MTENPEPQDQPKTKRSRRQSKAAIDWNEKYKTSVQVRYFGSADIEGTIHRTFGEAFTEGYVGVIRLEGMANPVRLSKLQVIQE